jgi:hypothetical protein
MHQNDNTYKDTPVGPGPGLEVALIELQVARIEFTVEGDEIDGRVAHIAYLNERGEDCGARVPDSVKAVVFSRLDLDRRVFELNHGDDERGTRLMWDLAQTVRDQ